VHTDNLMCGWRRPAGAQQEVRYTFRSAERESYAPRFTYHGFRFAQVTGLQQRSPPDALEAEVFHSAPEVGRFASSSPPTSTA
jgi:hypothetical protein